MTLENHDGESLPLDLAWQIHGVCEKFEEALTAGRGPNIEEYLPQVGAPARSRLVCELVAIEIEFRRTKGEDVIPPEEYVTRFPDYHLAVQEAFARVNDRASSDPSMAPTVSVSHVELRTASDRYVPTRFHARAGMGEIWEATDTELGRQVALKFPRAKLSDQLDRFLAEAQVTAQLEHPYVVPVHDLGLDGQGQLFYVMKFVDGATLKTRIQDYHGRSNGSSTECQVERLKLLEVFVHMCEAISFAHDHGVIHRDIKPDNVMLGQHGETLVIDWGCAKLTNQLDLPGERVIVPSSGNSSGTQSGSVIGSPPYMPPEMAAGHSDEAGWPCDVYLLGGTLYHILTGHAPRTGRSQDEMIEMARTVPPVPPRRLNPNIDRPLEAICLKALATRTVDRYESAMDLVADVRRHMAGEPVSVYREKLATRVGRWTRRHQQAVGRTMVALIVAASLFLAFIGYGAWSRERLSKQIDEFHALLDALYFYGGSVYPTLPPYGQDTDANARNIESSPATTPRDVGMFDRSQALKAGQDALTVAEGWGSELERIPEARRQELTAELAQLLLLMAQVELVSQLDAKAKESARAWIDRAEALDSGTRYSCIRLRNMIDGRNVNDDSDSDAGQEPWSAFDYFVAGEYTRQQSATRRDNTDRKKSLERAREYYQAAIDLQPRHYWARFQLGRCYLGLGQFTEAAESLSACVGLQQEKPWAYSTLAIAKAQQARITPRARERAQLIASATGDFEKALDLAQKPGGDDRPIRLNHALMHLQNNQAPLALNELNQLVDSENPLVEAYYYLGQLHLKNGDFQLAKDDFDKLVNARPSFQHVYLVRAQARAHLNDLPGVISDLNAYFGDNTNSLTRGITLRRMAGSVSDPTALRGQAAQEFQSAVNNGAGARAHFELAALRADARQYSQVITAATAGLSLHPNHIGLLETRGYAYFFTINNEKAKEDFIRATQIAPSQGEDRDFEIITQAGAYAWLGCLAAIDGDADQTQRHVLKSISILDSTRWRHYGVAANQASAIGILAQKITGDKRALHDVALHFLRQAVALAKNNAVASAGLKELMQSTDFGDDLKALPEFQQLRSQL